MLLWRVFEKISVTCVWCDYWVGKCAIYMGIFFNGTFNFLQHIITTTTLYTSTLIFQVSGSDMYIKWPPWYVATILRILSLWLQHSFLNLNTEDSGFTAHEVFLVEYWVIYLNILILISNIGVLIQYYTSFVLMIVHNHYCYYWSDWLLNKFSTQDLFRWRPLLFPTTVRPVTSQQQWAWVQESRPEDWGDSRGRDLLAAEQNILLLFIPNSEILRTSTWELGGMNTSILIQGRPL